MKHTSAYQNLEWQPLGGHWRTGRAGRKLDVTNPFNGEPLLTVPMASAEDAACALPSAFAPA
jgi:acyl-CoA reductase-like NAD-dependent aldehyde dehydrogenase